MIDLFNVIIPSAGSGSRYESKIPKQYEDLNGRSVINHSIYKFLELEECKNIVIPTDNSTYRDQIALGDKITIIEGGSSRAESVKLGFDYLYSIDSSSNVLIHDAVRPCIQIADLKRFLEKFSDSDQAGSIFAVPCSDTIKSSQSGKIIDTTLDRSNLWQAQTPQIFKCEALKTVYDKFGDNLSNVTDESSLFESGKYLISLFESSSLNLKITYKEDMQLAKSILKNFI